jgi:hypothetical protein
MIPKHPNKKQFACIQKNRFETALSEVPLNLRLKIRLNSNHIEYVPATCNLCGQYFWNCICHNPFI